MRRAIGRVRRIDDEWYTPRATADGVAAWLAKHLTPDTPILCPADILPDGSESTIPQALRAAGFTSVRVTRDLPVDDLYADWIEGEVVVTNPPFSLLVPFREWCRTTGARFCILACPGRMRRCWSIPEMNRSVSRHQWAIRSCRVDAKYPRHQRARPITRHRQLPRLRTQGVPQELHDRTPETGRRQTALRLGRRRGYWRSWLVLRELHHERQDSLR